MATLTVRVGLSDIALPLGQVLIIGKQKLIKKLDFKQVSAKFGALVSADHFTNAVASIVSNSASSVPLYMNHAQIMSISDDSSRHNAPSNAHAITRAIKSTTINVSTKLSIVTVVDYADVLASVCAIARVFPLYDRKTKKANNDQQKKTESVSIELLLSDHDKTLSAQEVDVLQSLVNSIRTTAMLVDMPCNELNSIDLTDEAIKLIDTLPVKIDRYILKGEELKTNGFGGVYNVGKAALHPPVFACFSYRPAGAEKTFALVGKGIVYDTGGMQLKTKSTMPSMKRDMGGAAAVLTAFATLIHAGFNQNLHLLLCIAENMISPLANKPDDVITMLSGKTVEINNTDAEGRLVLADGVFYAHTVLKANTIIDMATLTGAQAYATGQKHAAIMSNKEQLEQCTVDAGLYSGDLCHPLPYCPDLFFADLSSPIADMRNANLGKMQGPPSAVAALFIGSHINFTDDVDWLHIDIAAPCETGDRATGYGPALIVALLGQHTEIPILSHHL